MDEKKGSIKVYGDVCLRKERRKRQKILIIELFLDYAKHSTLHGLRYIAERGLTYIEKFFWLMTFLLSLSLCLFLIRNVFIKWKTSPVIVSFSEEVISVAKVPFPSVTICPQDKIVTERFNYSDVYARVRNKTAYEAELKKFYDVSILCDIHTVGVKDNFTNSSLVDNLLQVAPTVDEVFNYCSWRNKYVKCSQIFHVALTNVGVCYTFNALAASDMFKDRARKDYDLVRTTERSRNWTATEGYMNLDEEPYPRRGRENGASPDLEVVMMEPNMSSKGLCNSLSNGFKVFVQNPADLPQSSHYYYAALPKQVSSIAVKFNMLNTSENLINYDPEVRQCYFSKDKTLRYFKVYTPSNCRLECLANFTLAICDCVWFNMPHDNGTKICTIKKKDCVDDVQDKLTKLELRADLGEKNVTACRCLPACYSVQYDAEILKTSFDVKNYFKQMESIYHTNFGNDKFEYSKIEMYFKEPRFISMRRSELFGLTDFLANCGGLLGLFLGFSFLSLVEIFYFVSLRLCCLIRGDLKEEKKNLKRQESVNSAVSQ